MKKCYFFVSLIAFLFSSLNVFASFATIGGLRYYLDQGSYTAIIYPDNSDQGNNYIGLREIIIPATVQYEGTTYNVTEIQNRAFYGCPDLETIEIGENIERIGTTSSCYVFDSPKLNKIKWKAKNCKGWDYYYSPFGGTGSGGWIDGGAKRITTIEFTDEVETIPQYLCLNMINLDTISFGKNIISIGRGNLSYFKNVKITDLSAYCQIYNAYSSDKFPVGFKLFLNDVEIDNLVIPEEITTIPDFTFQGCSSIHSLNITKNVANISAGAFINCFNLSNVIFASTSCSDLNDVIFSNNAIDEIIFSNNVTRIPSFICNNQPIQLITIPSSVETIGANAFSGCSQINHVYWNAIKCEVVDNGLFNSSSSNITSFIFGNGIEEIPHHICYNMNNLTSITIPYGVIRINNNAFQRCSNLTAITIPNSVTTLGESAFYGCTAWRVVLPNSLKYIGKNALYNTFTYNLDKSWTDNVLYIENYLIKCKETNNVSSYSIKEGTTVIADAAFESITSLSSVNIPNSITHIGNKAFYNCQDIVSINIPKNIESIGEYAMYISYQKESPLGGALLLPATLKHIGNYAFYKWKKSSIYAQMQNPPSITSTTFGLARTVTNTPVYVYHDNVNSYFQAEVWKQFDIVSAYKVVFTNEGGTIIEEQMIGYGEDAIPPTMPEREGYQFAGWDKPYTNITNDIVFKAIYKPAKYEVIFYDYDYTVLKSDSVLYGNNAIPPKDPIRQGYIFIGWDKDYSNVKSDLHIIAQYEQDIIYYTVTFLDWDGTELHIEKVEEGKDAQGPPTEPKRDGYKFIGWSKPVTNITTNLTVIALYDEASAVDEVEAQGTAIRKLIEDHQLRIILPNGDKYDAMGQKL